MANSMALAMAAPDPSMVMSPSSPNAVGRGALIGSKSALSDGDSDAGTGGLRRRRKIPLNISRSIPNIIRASTYLSQHLRPGD